MTKTPNLKSAIVALAITGATAFGTTAAMAAGHGIDLTGKTVEYVIPFSESGGSAKWANFYAPLLCEALPGNPTVVVRYRPARGRPRAPTGSRSRPRTTAR